MVEVERLCERVVFIAGGQIVADGTPNDVAAMFGHGDLESVFLQLAGTDMDPEETTAMSWLRIMTVVRRHWYVLWRSPNRWFDIAVWPLFDVLLFGSLGAFVAQENTTSRADGPLSARRHHALPRSVPMPDRGHDGVHGRDVVAQPAQHHDDAHHRG